LYLQAFDSSERTVVRHQCQANQHRVGSDHQVEVSNGLTAVLKHGAKLALLPSRIGVPGKDCHAQKKFLHDYAETGGCI
jgi:hypothetical protein